MTIRFARWAAAGIALAVASPAFADDWRVSTISGEKPARTVYLIDVSSILRDGDTVTFMTQSIFENTTANRNFDRSITRRRGSCSAMSSQIIENSYYANRVFLNTELTPGDVITHRDGTIMHDVLAQACGIKAINAATIANPESQVRGYFAK